MWKRKKKCENVVFLEADKILPNPYAARQSFPAEGLRTLAASLSRYGMLSPITVRRQGEEYELILGERRLRAAKLLGWEKVPCRLIDAGSRLGAELTLAENLLREDLDLFEEASALDRLCRTFRYTQAELAERVGLSQSAVAGKLRLLRLGAEERLIITEHHLSQRHARALLRVQDDQLRLFALKYIVERGYNVSQSETFLEALISHPDEFILAFKPKPEPTRSASRKTVVKDVRLFVNSVDKAIFHIREAGFTVEADKTEEESFISYRIRIPKYSKS